ncbi:MAG: pyridoxamine 5'-phosphate oxidase family protein [Bacteroidota bacterium]|nr:pyridoxamine 5'-phosphate oxidase family protein [Bacteroidota bacterium]
MKSNILDESKFSEIEDIISKCQVCYVGMSDGENPYVLPFNFGYKDKTIYLHSGKEGKKIEILRKNNKVSIAFSTDHLLRFQNEEVACSWGMKYRSVIAFGEVEFINDIDEKTRCMNIIMDNYTNKNFKYNSPSILNVKIFKIKINKVTGKVFGY